MKNKLEITYDKSLSADFRKENGVFYTSNFVAVYMVKESYFLKFVGY